MTTIVTTLTKLINLNRPRTQVQIKTLVQLSFLQVVLFNNDLETNKTIYPECRSKTNRLIVVKDA